MGRQQGFDTATAVRDARRVFWRCGYEGTSVPELEAATGLGRSSLYHAFGSKRGLFDAAVASYLDEVVRPRLRPLTVTDGPAPGALAAYLTGLREALAHAATTGGAPGCLLVNTATAPIGDDDAVRATVAAYRAELRAAFGAGVDAARPDLDDAARARLAETVTAHVLAAMALARADPSASLACLDAALGAVAP